jgi:KDO2-lipid IV(A) lauroyltransferase
VVNGVPGRLRYGAARLAGNLAYLVGADLRRQARENYAAILGAPVDSPRVGRVAREAVVGYTKLMADFLWLPALSQERIREVVEVGGLENIDDALALRRGAIVVTPHFGNWDMAAAAAVAHGVRLTAVTDRFGDAALDRQVTGARQKFGMKCVPVGVEAGRAVLRALRDNEVVALVCDLPKEGRNVRVDLCGQPAMVPAGPALLALRTGAPLVPITCRRLADNRYHLEIERRVAFTPTGRDAVDVPALAQAIVDRFAATLRAVPEQWYLFSRMWGLADGTPLGAGVAVAR